MIQRHPRTMESQTQEKCRDVSVSFTPSKAATKHRGVADAFHAFARKCSELFGHPWSFSLAIILIAGWAISGPIFGFSDTWQLVINTATTIVTFLMVFMIQNTQNRDARAIHLKLDELLHGVKGARNRLICLEHLTEEELNQLQEEFARLRKAAPSEGTNIKQEQKA
jgi:low affinity Fe/Cu permease